MLVLVLVLVLVLETDGLGHGHPPPEVVARGGMGKRNESGRSSWGALQAALGSDNPMPVDRIHVDTQADQAAPLLAQRKIVAVPALYLLDANGFVIDMLQGDLQESDVRKALQ